MTAATAEAPAERLARYAGHREQLTARRTSIVADLAELDEQRRTALLAGGGDSVPLAGRTRELRDDLAAVDDDLAEVDGWIGQANAEIRAERDRARAAEAAALYERTVGELRAADRRVADWIDGAPVRLERAIAEAAAFVEQMIADVAAVRSAVDTAHGLRNVARQLAPSDRLPAPPADPVNHVAHQLRHDPRRMRLFLAAARGNRADLLTTLIENIA